MQNLYAPPPRFSRVVDQAMARSRRVSPGGRPTSEHVGPFTLETAAHFMITRPGLAPNLGYVEALSILAGQFRPEAIKRAAPKANQQLFTARGAYGPRLAEWLPRAIDELVKDPYTRRAIAYIAGAGKDQAPDGGLIEDLPCTQQVQFFLRDHPSPLLVLPDLRDPAGRIYELSSHWTMRSWDAAWGLPYDLQQFGLVTQIVADFTNAYFSANGHGNIDFLCPMSVTAGSFHIYDDTRALVDQQRWAPVPTLWAMWNLLQTSVRASTPEADLEHYIDLDADEASDRAAMMHDICRHKSVAEAWKILVVDPARSVLDAFDAGRISSLAFAIGTEG